MSSEHEPDDRELEDFLSGKSALSSAYREASRESAPAALDAPILDAAKTAARQPAPRAARRGTWLRPLAYAATFVLSTSLLLNVWREPELRNQVVPGDEAGPPAPVELESGAPSERASMPEKKSADAAMEDRRIAHATDEALAKEKTLQSAALERSRQANQAQEEERRHEFYRQLEQGEAIGSVDDRAKYEAHSAARSEAPQAAIVMPRPEPAQPMPAKPEPPRQEMGAAGAAGGFAPEPPPAAPSAAPAPAPVVESDAMVAPQADSAPAVSREDASRDLHSAMDRDDARAVEERVARIRALRDRGDLDGARRELEALRKAYPGFEVPADLRRLQPEAPP
ncbi:MAG TPA: hypothetical protein VJM11_08200 [Nevskiaceae bacterium]|nr:hypothetical protein [Nevskiaceae bacterium]